MPMLQSFIDSYTAKKSRWDTLIDSFLAFPVPERRDFIAKLILLEDAESIANHPPDGGERKLRLCDIVMHALISAEHPLTSPEIYTAARLVKKGIKKKSLETTVSKMAHGSIIKRTGVNDEGRKLYSVIPQPN
jgi:hypothetical protein